MPCWHVRDAAGQLPSLRHEDSENSSLLAVQLMYFSLGLGQIENPPTLGRAHQYASRPSVETCNNSHIEGDVIRELSVVRHDNFCESSSAILKPWSCCIPLDIWTFARSFFCYVPHKKCSFCGNPEGWTHQFIHVLVLPTFSSLLST